MEDLQNNGHVEGDKALVIVANALRITSEQLGGFVAHYGGDEFCYIIVGREADTEFIKSCIRKNLKELQMKMQPDNRYSLSISIGYNTVTNPEADIMSGIEQADKLLYADKKRENNSRL